MGGFLKILAVMAVVAVCLALFAWLGHALGTRAARKYPSLAVGLYLINYLFRMDPPPPPTMETIREGETERSAGDPPTT